MMPFLDRQAAVIETQHLRALSVTLRGDSVQACSQADVARQELRYTLLRYGLRRMHSLRGASEVNSDGDRRRLLIRAIAAPALVAVSIHASTGATRLMCSAAISPGTPQYEIEVGQSTVIVDVNCYKTSLQDIVETLPDAAI